MGGAEIVPFESILLAIVYRIHTNEPIIHFTVKKRRRTIVISNHKVQNIDWGRTSTAAAQ